ncbi:MAG: family N-acetyltransferase [Pedosphaera sp.]|nr:family N-acetyltransferase [Pedosphaera sp.]
MPPTLQSPDVRYREAFLRMFASYAAAGSDEWCSAAVEAPGDFEFYVKKLQAEAAGIGIAGDWVPTSHFWLRLGPDLVGTLRVRHFLTPAVEQRAGHIGYDIAPAFRRQGLGHEIVRLGLIEATKLGIGDILAICGESNEASRRILERHGAEVEKVRDGEVWYWIRRSG